jgi:hypothetical protein
MGKKRESNGNRELPTISVLLKRVTKKPHYREGGEPHGFGCGSILKHIFPINFENDGQCTINKSDSNAIQKEKVTTSENSHLNQTKSANKIKKLSTFICDRTPQQDGRCGHKKHPTKNNQTSPLQ